MCLKDIARKDACTSYLSSDKFIKHGCIPLSNHNIYLYENFHIIIIIIIIFWESAVHISMDVPANTRFSAVHICLLILLSRLYRFSYIIYSISISMHLSSLFTLIPLRPPPRRIVLFSALDFPHLHFVLYTNLRKFSNSEFLVQLFIFLYAVCSFMFNHLLVRNFTLQLWVLYSYIINSRLFYMEGS